MSEKEQLAITSSNTTTMVHWLYRSAYYKHVLFWIFAQIAKHVLF